MTLVTLLVLLNTWTVANYMWCCAVVGSATDSRVYWVSSTNCTSVFFNSSTGRGGHRIRPLQIVALYWQVTDMCQPHLCLSVLAQSSKSQITYSDVHCLKNDTDIDVADCNFDADQSILIVFGRDVAERVCYQRWYVISPVLTNVSALSGEKRTPKIVCFQSCCIPCLKNEMARRQIIFAHYT